MQVTELLRRDCDLKINLFKISTYLFYFLVGLYAMCSYDKRATNYFTLSEKIGESSCFNYIQYATEPSKSIYCVFIAIILFFLFSCFIGLYKSKLTQKIGEDLYLEEMNNEGENYDL